MFDTARDMGRSSRPGGHHAAPRYVLFDLDGTLVRPGASMQRLHMGAMAEAIADVCGVLEPFRYEGGQLFYADIDLAGFTDAGTVHAALRHHGVPASGVDDCAGRVMTAMAGRIGGRDDAPGGRWADRLPGARALLAALRAGGFALGMSTGNARAVARWKMHCLGLTDLLRDGGFGDRARDRDDVVSAGVRALNRPGARGLVVGDTAKDVTAAHASGLPCLAVATGATSAADLAAAGADAIVADLTGDEALAAVHRLTAD